MAAKKGAPVYSLHPPMVATLPDMPLDNSPASMAAQVYNTHMQCYMQCSHAMYPTCNVTSRILTEYTHARDHRQELRFAPFGIAA